MTQSIPLYIVLLLVAGAAILYALWRWVSAILLSARRTADAAEALRNALLSASDTFAANSDALVKLTAALGPAAEELKANMQGVPKLLEAVAKMGAALVDAVQALRAEKEEAKRNPFGRTNGPLPARDVNAANLEDEVMRLMRAEGISRDEALLRMNPANAGSVWEGVMTDWR